MTEQRNVPHENETTHDTEAVTRPEQTPQEGRFDIGDGVSGVAETAVSDESDDDAPGTDAGFDDVRRSIEGTGEDRNA